MLLSHYNTEGLVEAGVDEVGRGCLAGPVVAAAVIFPPDYTHPLLNDSKRLPPRLRLKLREEIVRDAVAWSLGEASAEEIDSLNIQQATFLAMRRALDGLKVRPGFIVVDGNRFPGYGNVSFATVVKGDATYLSIAAASILAKTYRDEKMAQLSRTYPLYAWERNVGYPTAEHARAVYQYGLTPYHRRSFRIPKITVDWPQGHGAGGVR